MNSFRIPKHTGTHADVFAAVGLADLLSDIDSRVSIADQMHSFVVTLTHPLTVDLLKDLGKNPGYFFLRPKASDPIPPAVGKDLVLDYQEQKEKANRQKERDIAKRAGADVSEEAAEDAPVPDFRLYQVLNALQGDGATNKMLLTIVQLDVTTWHNTLWASLQSLHQLQPLKLDWATDLVQLFNPHAAKGYARLKPDSTGRGDKTKDAWGEPFMEWLRFRGFFRCAAPFFLGSKSENIRILTPIPKFITMRRLSAAVAELRQSRLSGSAPKIDCLGTLRLAQILIRDSEAATLCPPNKLVEGIVVTHYQSMGNAKTVTSTETLALPGWFDLSTPQEADLWYTVLEEHFRALRILEDRNSDEIGMLMQYRRFLQQRGPRGIHELLVFMESYGIFLIRKRAQESRWRHRQFSLEYLEKILMPEPDYAQIIQNPGFQAVAAAIRSATVSAQSLKRNKRDHRDIRYDVLPELRRKRSLSDSGPFLEAIADFIATYNAESARRLEQGKPTNIKRIATDDLGEFLSLFRNRKDASVLGALLCAYATCKEPAEPEVPVQETQETTESEN